MNTPTRDELLTALQAHDSAERAWRDFVHALQDGDHVESGGSVPLDQECRRAWRALLAIAERLPDRDPKELNHEVG